LNGFQGLTANDLVLDHDLCTASSGGISTVRLAASVKD
jgi:hypothetical protein